MPRNSGVFGWCEDAARGFSARRTWAARLGEKIFKNFLERGGKPKNWGAGEVGRWHVRTLYRVREAIFGSGSETSGSVARGVLRAGTSTAGTRLRSQRFTPLICREPTRKLHRSLYGGISACPTRNFSNLHLWLEATRLPYPGYDHILSK